MLKQRVITAIILIPIFVYFVLTLSTPAFATLTLIFVLLGAWEWSGLMGIQSVFKKLIYPLILLILLPLSLYLPINSVLSVAFLWWCSTLILIATFPASGERWGNSIVVRGLMGFLVLMPCWRAINFIHANALNGPIILLFLFVLIWGADSAAYFIGKKWGQHKLAPNVSPGKSWEGFLAAIIVGFLISLGALFWSHSPMRIWPLALVLGVITVMSSVVGDLFESMLKRQAGVKDSGVLMPGHGGVLDRIDSLTAAAPVFALGAILLGKMFH